MNITENNMMRKWKMKLKKTGKKSKTKMMMMMKTRKLLGRTMKRLVNKKMNLSKILLKMILAIMMKISNARNLLERK